MMVRGGSPLPRRMAWLTKALASLAQWVRLIAKYERMPRLVDKLTFLTEAATKIEDLQGLVEKR